MQDSALLPLFIDPFKEGHRLSHGEALLAHAERDPAQRFVLALHESLVSRLQATPRWAAVLGKQVTLVPLGDDVAQGVKPNNKDIPGGLRLIRLAEQLAAAHGCNHVHFLHLDTVLLALFVRSFTGMKLPVSGMYMTATEHYGSLFGANLSRGERLFAHVKRLVVSRLLSRRKITAIHVFDEFVPAFYQRHAKGHKVIAIPDFAPMPTESRQPDGMESWLAAPNRFSLFGAIEDRKGIFPLLDGLMLLDAGQASGISLALLGRFQGHTRDRFNEVMESLRQARPEIRVAVVDRFVDDEEILWLCRNSTAIMMPYQRHRGSSGVLVWAAHARVPVLAQSFGLMGREVNDHKLGIAVNSEDPVAIAEGLKALIAQADEPYDAAAITWAERHTAEEFARQTILNLAAPEGTVTPRQ
jgi:glycosyltransferase involved in cell wall biosynthesis